MTASLSMADVARLMSDPSPQARADTAAKIASAFDRNGLSDAERRVAEDIFRVMVRDVEVRVREALAQHLKSTPEMPHDVAVALARDVDSVALPILKFSEVLTDEDLIAIVRDTGAAKQVAIAQRQVVSSSVADALIDTGNEKAVARLVSNEGASLSEQALGRVMTDYRGSDWVSDSLARRPNLPAAMAEQLMTALSEKLQYALLAKHGLPADQIATLIMQARERATISLLREGSSEADLERLVDQLYANRRLTPSLVLRALCMGDVAFFEMAMARLAGVRLENARILIHDPGKLGFGSLYGKSGLPQQLFSPFRTALDTVFETDYDGGQNDRERFVARVVERLLTQLEDSAVRMAEDDLEYLMTKLHHLAA